MPRRKTPSSTPILYTVGHSTRTLEEFLELLKAHGIEAIADVRRYPKSRRLPHFNDESLAVELGGAGIRYVPFLALGGRRRARADSINTGWRSESFRGYADYMQTPAFSDALEGLMEAAMKAPTAMMCAEAVPWRCHRSLIADALLARKWRVIDLMSKKKAEPHQLTPFARVNGPQVTYPGEATLFDGPDDSVQNP